MPVSKKPQGFDRKKIMTKPFTRSSKRIGNLKDRSSKDKPEYRTIKRNQYLKDKKKDMVKDHGIFCSCSPSPDSSKVCGTDCHCGLLESTCSSSCKCKCKCSNKPFQKRRIKKMKVVKTDKCGQGIVADEDIESGEFIVEYVGEVIDDKICEERFWELKRKVETNFYLCEINRDMLIDATRKGNKSRYFNHSCNPNTEILKRLNDGEIRLGIFAKRNIKRGEALTYDYQCDTKKHRRYVSFGPDKDCLCGEACCRRKLGAKPIKTKNKPADKVVKPPKTSKGGKTRGRRAAGQSWNNNSQRRICFQSCIGVVIWLARPMKERCFGIIRDFDEFTRKHLVMYEDGVTEMIDMSREVWKFVTL